jgi:hypothetical protein
METDTNKNEEPRQSTPQHEKVLITEYRHSDENGNICAGVRIHPEFEKLIHPLSDKELWELEASIKEKGCLDPIKVWQGYIVDGHHRHRICEENNIPFEVIDMDFEDEWAVKLWMLNNQLGRRNLSDVARIEYASLKTEIIRGIAQRNQEDSRFQKDVDLSKLDSKTRRHFERKGEKKGVLVNAAVGSMAGVSPSTVKRYNYVKQHADEETLRALREGKLVPFGKKRKKTKLSIDGLYRELRGKEKNNAQSRGSIDPHRKDNLKVIVDSEAKETQVKIMPRKDLPTEGIFTRIITHPISELRKFVEASSVDLIITEPPCKEEHIDLFDQLGDFSRHALKEGAPCVVIAGIEFLFDFLEMLSAHLDICWTLSFMQPESVCEAPGRTVKSSWKPVLIFTKGSYNGDVFSDVVLDPFTGIDQLVDAFSYHGETVCDPFCNQGAIGRSCLSKGRSFVGSDIDVEKTLALKEALETKKSSVEA